MFGKRSDDPANFRAHARRVARDLTVLVDGRPCDLLDYSNGGIRIATDHLTRRVALVEVYRGSSLYKKCAAVVAWRRGGQVGYAFNNNLKLCEIEETERDLAELRHHAEEQARPGAIGGNALRKRLNL